MNKRVTVVILNWNGKGLLEVFLPSVVRNSPRHLVEVMVADNGSTDGSVEYLKEKFPEVRILPFDRNHGFADGYNKAMMEVRTPYAVLLNNDVEVTPGWCDAPLRLLEAWVDIACVQPKIRSWKNRIYFEYAGAAGGYLDRYGYPFCKGRIFDVVEFDYGQYDKPAEILWGSGACLFVKTKVFQKEGGFDGYFFAHQEEVDFCWRLRCRGYRIMYEPGSFVLHKGGATLEVGNPHKTFLNFRNNLLMVYKNTSKKELNHVLRVRFWLDYLAAFKFLLDKQWGDARAVIRARRSFHNLKDVYARARTDNLDRTKVESIPEQMRGCILWAFHYRKQKTFCSLKGFGEGVFKNI